MSKTTTSRKAVREERHPASPAGRAPGRPDPALSALQAKADGSSATKSLNTLQLSAKAVIQRETPVKSDAADWAKEDYINKVGKEGTVDTSPSQSLPALGPNQDPSWKAVDRTGTPQWAEDDYVNKVGKTGSVDASPGPRMPALAPNAEPSWKKVDRTGVPEWAKQDYIREAPKTLIASVADGKIGSIYFPGGRIRTTHGSGPAKEEHGETLQYNIDYDAALAEFDKKTPDLYPNTLAALRQKYADDPEFTDRDLKKAAAKHYYKNAHRYISGKLNVTNPSKMPYWIRLFTGRSKLPSWAGDAIKSPDDAPGMATQTDRTLFEIFRGINGQVEGWHPSRGAAKKWETNKQVISVLNAAIKHIKDIDGAPARNAAFYEFIQRRIPAFAAQIRRPDEI
ncbi:hypothetical protein So717_04420 [Roseobacter cerasinus]|uniref:Uncharacterized protein n=1 Tax=Roseobacter cerasinus TaxID=2602289 RepID=A0A640VKS9_9RHOB|nr:hypothetical protein [Roseobacter cerasinus]GFE48689.1 hypothetical protein So717_04420 [Roseobacter cerasinus]